MCAQNQARSTANPNPQKIAPTAVVVIYSSWTMKNALASLVNLVTLLIGIAIGIMLAPHLEKPVKAVSAEPQASPANPSQGAVPSNIEQIQPAISAGSSGFYLLLAHHIQADELVVNGVDLIKLEQGELNLLSRTLGVNPQDVQNIVNQAKDTHLYQVATPKQPPPANTPPK